MGKIWYCIYCKIKGSESYIKSVGPHHEVSCPRWRSERRHDYVTDGLMGYGPHADKLGPRHKRYKP